MRYFYVPKKWSSAKLSLNPDLSLNKMSLNWDCTVLKRGNVSIKSRAGYDSVSTVANKVTKLMRQSVKQSWAGRMPKTGRSKNCTALQTERFLVLFSKTLNFRAFVARYSFSKHQNHKKDGTNFCGLLRKAKLYKRRSTDDLNCNIFQSGD